MINDDVMDLSLQNIKSTSNKLYLCTQVPATYAEAITTYAMGYKNNPVISNPIVRTEGGRKITISAITDGVVTKSATATHYALVDSTLNVLKAADSLGIAMPLLISAPFTLDAFDISIID